MIDGPGAELAVGADPPLPPDATGDAEACTVLTEGDAALGVAPIEDPGFGGGTLLDGLSSGLEEATDFAEDDAVTTRLEMADLTGVSEGAMELATGVAVPPLETVCDGAGDENATLGVTVAKIERVGSGETGLDDATIVPEADGVGTTGEGEPTLTEGVNVGRTDVVGPLLTAGEGVTELSPCDTEGDNATEIDAACVGETSAVTSALGEIVGVSGPEGTTVGEALAGVTELLEEEVGVGNVVPDIVLEADGTTVVWTDGDTAAVANALIDAGTSELGVNDTLNVADGPADPATLAEMDADPVIATLTDTVASDDTVGETTPFDDDGEADAD